jgi:hypothetical protein
MVGLVSSIALFIPIIIILAFRLAWYKSFPALLVYFFLVSSYNFLALDFMKSDKNFLYYFGILDNLLDAPLMLTFLTYFSKTAVFRKRLKIMIPVFFLFELIVIAAVGFNRDAVTIVLAPGLVLVVSLSLLFFIHQVKITVVYQKAAGKAMIAASLLFAYGGYTFVYIVYNLLKTNYKVDTFFVYYIVSILSSLLLSTGIYMERKRVRQLNELKVAREELKVIYGS